MVNLIALIVFFLGIFGYATCIVRVPLPPEPRIVSPQNVTVPAGRTAVLRCIVENLGPKTVVWSLAAQTTPLTIGSLVFTHDSDISIDVIPEIGRISYNLKIANTQLEDSGVYQCRITSRAFIAQNYFLTVMTA